MPLPEEEREYGDGDDGEDGGDEGALHHEGVVTLVAEAEHGAEGGYGHADEDGVDAVDGLVDAEGSEEEVHAARDEEETEEGGDIDGGGAQHAARGDGGDGGTDDEQGTGDGDVAD